MSDNNLQIADKSFHTGVVTGSIPVSPTIFSLQNQSLSGSYKSANWPTDKDLRTFLRTHSEEEDSMVRDFCKAFFHDMACFGLACGVAYLTRDYWFDAFVRFARSLP